MKLNLRILSLRAVTVFVSLSTSLTAAGFPVFSHEEAPRVDWPRLDQRSYKIELLSHKARVLHIAEQIAPFFRVNPESVAAVAQVHDDAKLVPEFMNMLVENYQTHLNEKDRIVLNGMNRVDDELTRRAMALQGMIDLDGRIYYEGRLVQMIIDIADKMDRYLYPDALARSLFGKTSYRANSPEFGKVMVPMSEYIDVSEYARSYNFNSPETIEKIQNYVEFNYFDWVSRARLIPVRIYGLTCSSLF
ncbi:MAG: hypothetical protein R2827_09180 [Bdellovibrionales bacterium]